MFLITRFTHGSAGKFLSSILQTSDKIDHWSGVIQSNKSNIQLIDSLLIEYTKRSFPENHNNHIMLEPMVPYNVDLYSAGYARGNDVLLDHYLKNAHEKNDARLIECLRSKLKPNIVFHKPDIPVFCNGSSVVTITVTSDKEKSWLYNTLWSKQFLELDDEIRYVPSDPEYCNFNSIVQVLTYKNPYKFPKSMKEQLYEEYVVNDHTNPWYFDPDKFRQFDKENNLDNIFINLAEILIKDNFLHAVDRIFKKFELGQPNLPLISMLHSIWISRQLSYDS